MYPNHSTKLEKAQAYVALGFAVLPCHTLENGRCSCPNANCDAIAKHPLTTHGVNSATKDAGTLQQYFSDEYEAANIALATGEPSGVSVIDVDDIGALTALESQHGSFPKTWTAETGSGGRHYYFRHDERWATCKNAVKFAGALDCRATGAYALLPPSVHASGNEYRWIVSPGECEVADAPDWLIALVPKRDDTPAAKEKPGIADAPRSGAYSLASSQTAGTPFTIQRAATLEDRLTLYLAKCPTQNVSGNLSFSVVCRCVELFGALSDDEIIAGVLVWNERCDRPRTKAKLRHKLADARAKVTQSIATDPIPTAHVSDADDWPTLDASAYVGIVGEIVRAIEPETEADPAGVLLTLLTCLGNAIGKHPTFSVGGGSHHANLFACLVGDTSSGKGQAWDVAEYLVRHVDEAWRRNCIVYGLSSGEGLIERVSDPSNDDGTPLLSVVPVQRLLCLETEFARPITAMRREGNTLSPLLRSAWDGKTLEVLTRGKSKLRASNAYVSVVAHITADELRKLLTQSVETTNGFANRFLWALVRSTKDLPNGGGISVLDRFVDRLRATLERAKAIGTMTRSPDAERLWSDVYASLKHASVRATERGRPQVLRLAMLYALLDSSPTIDTQHLRAALAVWRYCDASARLIFGNADTSAKPETLDDKLLRIVSRQPGVKRRDLQRSLSHRITADAFGAALQRLIASGELIAVTADGSECFYIGVGTGDGDTTSRPEHAAGTGDGDNSPIPPTAHCPPVPVPLSPSPASSNVKPATLAQLFDWRNLNSVAFVQRGDGVVWVTPVDALTPAIEAALYANQTTLAAFVASPADTPDAITPPGNSETRELSEDEFLSEMNAIYAERSQHRSNAVESDEVGRRIAEHLRQQNA